MEANHAEAAAPAAPPKPAKAKGNPLTDLIDSEKEYVDRLAGVIRKVAAAWSRSNFPPAELDAMFRAIEAVYRANRGFVSKLKEIGPNPSSPKALGDLLMRWIEDLDAPYTRYCNTYSVGFDSWEPVASNPALPPLLAGLSESHPPTAATSTPVDGSIPTSWTLDGLFAVPRIRLKYYKKLYSRLLKSTQPGRSDHKLLVGATERLDGLLAIAMSKLNVTVGTPEQENATAEPQGPPTSEAPLPPPPMVEEEREPIRPLPAVPQPEQPLTMENEHERRSVPVSIHQEPNGRVTSSLSGSSRSDRFSGEAANDRLSRETAPTSVSAGRSPSAMSNGRPSPGRGSGPSPAPFSAPSSPPLPPARSLFALQDALDTTRVLDIFSMKPKPCKLQLAQPVNPLPFDRIIKFEADVIVSFTPKATGEEVVYEKAHIVMLTDLFLVCEWAIEEGRDSPTLFLCFPPLAARHLKVVDEPVDLVDPSQTTFQVHVMRKETLLIRALSAEGKQRLARDFSRAVQEAINVAPPPRPPNGPPPQSGPPSAAQSPIGSPTMSQRIPPIMLPENDPGSDGPGAMPRSPSAHSFVETTGNTGTMLSPRNSESGLLNQFSRMGLGGGSETNLPLSNELPPGPGFGPQSRNPSFSNGPMPPPSPGFGPGPGGPPGPGGFPRGPPGPPFPPGGPFPPGRPGLPGPPGMGPPGPGMGHPPPGTDLQKSPSGRSLGPGRHPSDGHLPPLPGMPPQNFPPPGPYGPGGRPPLPPMPPQGYGFNGPPGHLPPRSRSQPPPGGPEDFDSPPTSPVEFNPNAITGPTVISAQMKCKVFLKQQHAQWKSLGAAKLKLFKQDVPIVVKQLVVEADNKNKDLLISTIVLTDGVERVGRTGIAIELSDKGVRTGIVYMLQLRNEAAATGLFNDLLAGSDRTGGRH